MRADLALCQGRTRAHVGIGERVRDRDVDGEVRPADDDVEVEAPVAYARGQLRGDRRASSAQHCRKRMYAHVVPPCGRRRSELGATSQ